MAGAGKTLAGRVRRWLLRLEDWLLVTMLSGMVLLAALQILLRNLAGLSLSWGDPTLRVAVLWTALLGALSAAREDNHIRIDVLSRFLPPPARRFSRLVTDVFSAVICALVAWHGARFVHFEWQAGSILFARVPAWAAASIIPLGFALMSLRFVAAAFARLGERGDA